MKGRIPNFQNRCFLFIYLLKGDKKMLESKFQSLVIKEVKDRFPGCVVLKNDPNYIQGFPDLLVLFNNRWAALEVKADEASSTQPNQAYYIDLLGTMSYARFINPTNKRDVIGDLELYFYPNS